MSIVPIHGTPARAFVWEHHRAGTALGYLRFYTYTLEHEDGASVKAAGFVEDGLTDGRSASEKGGRLRYDENLLGEKTRPEGRKRRWVRHVTRPHVQPTTEEVGQPVKGKA